MTDIRLFMWRQKLLNNNKKALNTAMQGWAYTAQTDVNYALKTIIKKERTSYSYDHLKITNKDELNELESLNQSTDRSITYASDSDIAILGCGPVGMTMALYLKKCQPKLKICIYEKRLNSAKNAIAPFTRYWLTHLEQSWISKVITDHDLRLIKKISLEGRIGVDIRNLEYMLLRAVRESEISVANTNEYTYNSEFLIDATGGRFLNQSQGDIKIIGNVNLSNTETMLTHTGKRLSNISPNRLKIARKGNVIFPTLDSQRLSFAYLKINYVDQNMKNIFVNYAHSLRDFGIYFWNGQMKRNNNRSLIFITLSGEDYAILSQHIKEPMYITALSEHISACKDISNRTLDLLEFINKQPAPSGAIAEPPFQWNPYFVPRSDIQINATKYTNIGDSFFNGNPMVGNGLGFHLHEINEIFN